MDGVLTILSQRFCDRLEISEKMDTDDRRIEWLPARSPSTGVLSGSPHTSTRSTLPL